jgi:type IV pilus assembly protein PilM
MALPFTNSQPKRPEQIIAVDLGGRHTKAVYVQRRAEAYTLVKYAVVDAPGFPKTSTPEGKEGEAKASPDQLAEHLKSVTQSLGARTKQVVLAMGVNDALVRPTDELPPVPVSDLRIMVKHATKKFLQEELPDYLFDCYIQPPRPDARPSDGKAAKAKVLVGGARRDLVENLQRAAKTATLIPLQIVPGLIGPANAFELAHANAYAAEVLALVDIGFRHTTITILMYGEFALCRVVAMGGDQLTASVAEVLGTSYEEAEGLKMGLTEDDRVQAAMQAVLTPLGRELRASIDFFEHQFDRQVTQVYLTGGSSRSEFIVQNLQSELMVNCRGWNPTGFMTIAVPPEQRVEIEQVAPQLAVAIGAAMAAF